MKRLWGIRHIRWLLLVIEFELWWRQARMIFVAPNPNDLRFLDDVWEGRA